MGWLCVAGRENGCADRECTDEFGTCVKQKEREITRDRENTIRSWDEARRIEEGGKGRGKREREKQSLCRRVGICEVGCV